MSPAANSNGWHKSPVTVTFTCSDAGSGIKTCPAAVTRDADAANLVVSGTATDVAGNTASASVTLNIDRTLPTIAVALTPPPAGGWITTPVTAHFTCTDGGSGIVTCPADHVVATEGARQTITGTVTDRAGNTASVTSPAFDVDFTPPSITYTMDPPSNADGWNSKGPVTVSFQCSDGASGVANCPAPQVVAAETAQQLVTVAATDRAGNSREITATVKLDMTAPFVSIGAPVGNTIVYAAATAVSAVVDDTLSSVVNATCNDSTATVSATNVNCSVTLTPGPNTIRVMAWDAAGNFGAGQVSLTYHRMPKVTLTSPVDLSYTNAAPPMVTVTGTVDVPGSTMTINTIQVPVAPDGSFSFGLPIAEGPNPITATATTPEGAVGNASVTVTLDTTPPHVTITSPPDRFLTTEATVSIAGIVNDIVVGTVNDEQATVTVKGNAAQVANRTFLAANVALGHGRNDIDVVGHDRVGNSAPTKITILRQEPTAAQIHRLSGDNQKAAIGAAVPDPLIVKLTNALAQPVANQAVIFKVTQNDGLIASTGPPAAATVVATTDGTGHARVNWTLGQRAGAGGNIVEAYAVGFEGTAIFTASGTLGVAGKIVVDTGNDQIGAIGEALPKPFIAVVVDQGNNRLGGVPVTFSVREGGGSFGEHQTLTLISDSDGRVAATLTLGMQEGNANNLVEATFPTNGGFPAAFTASGRALGNPRRTPPFPASC